MVQWVQVVFDGSKPRLSRPANPQSLLSKRAQNASLERPVMILLGVGMAEMTKKEERSWVQMVLDRTGCSV